MKWILIFSAAAVALVVMTMLERRQTATEFAGFEKWEREVIEMARETEDTNPGAYEVHLYCGHVFNDHKLRDQAIQQYQKAIAIDTKQPVAYASLGATYEILGDYTKAVDNWDAAKQRGEVKVAGTNINVYIDALKARIEMPKR